MGAPETARLIASLELQDKNFTRGLKQVERGIGRVDKKLGAFSGAINRTAIRAIDSLVSRAADIPGAVINAAVEQETAITGIAKTVNGNIDAIVDDLKRLSTETGSTFTELAGIAELGGAMGVAKDDLAAFTEQVAILGATTDVSVEDAATALGQLQNVIGLTGDEFDNFAASLVDLGNKGASTESQILEITKRAGASAKLFHIGKAEVLGWASAVANLGLEAEAGGTALGSLFQKSLPLFLKGNATIQKVTGKTAKELKQAFEKDASGALQSFIADLGELSEGDRLAAIQKLYGKNSALTKILLALSDDTDNLTESVDTGTKAWKEATAAQEEADKRFATSEFAFKRLNNSVNLMAATVGSELLPVLVDLAEEGIAWLNEPATQQNLKNFAKGLGEGVRGLAGIVKSIDWGAVAGFLGTAAGFAGQLVGWFTKMPGWAQAFLIGGFAVTKLPIIGDIVTSALKGALGITAGVVNVNGPVAGVPGGAGGAGGVLGSSRFGAAATLGTVFIAGASIAALAVAFQGFQTTVTESQQDLLEKVNATSEQGFTETINNLKATNTAIKNMNPLENVLAGIFGGSEIQKNFEAGADRIIAQLRAGELDNDEITTALKTLQEVVATNPELELPETDAAIKSLTAAINKKFVGPPKPEAKPRVSGVGDRPSPGNPRVFQKNLDKIGFEKWVTKAGEIKAAVIAESGAQKAELSNIKNSLATLDTTTTTTSADQTSEIARAKQAAATAGRQTSTAARAAGTTAAGASRAGAITVAGSMAAAASRIVSAVSALDLSVNVTTVNRTSTVNNRYGPSGGSSTTNRSGELE